MIKDGVINQNKKDMENNKELKTISELQSQIDHLNGLKYAIEMGIQNENISILIEEILNLFHGINIVGADYYAPKRLYSKIKGVKNIRFDDDPREILVKITSPRGYLLPKKVVINGIEFKINFWESSTFSENIDY